MKNTLQKATLFVGILWFIEIAVIGFMIVSIPSDPKNEFIWGISGYRLINLVIIIILESFILGALLQKSLINKFEKMVTSFLSEYANWAKSCWVGSMLSFFFFILLQIPAYRLKHFQLYWERLSPNLLMVELLAVTGLLTLIWLGYKKAYFPKTSHLNTREFFKLFSPFSIIVLALVLLVVVTKIGIEKDAYHWNTAGVPILSSQILLILFGYFILIGLRNYYLKKPIKTNTWIIFLILWGTASLVWVAQPIARNYFVYLPKETITNQYYPRSDSQRFTQGAELLLLGEGVYGGLSDEKPFLMVMISMAKAIGGGEFQNSINVQVIILALIIPGLYLIGKELYSSQFGIALAIIGVLYEINTLNSSGMINNVHIKLFMSEPYTLLGVVWATYFLILWMKESSYLYLGLITFSIIGFFTYVRTNMLGLFFVAFTVSLILPKQKLIVNIKRSLAASLAIIGINIPWAIYAYQKYGYVVVLNKIDTIFRTRVPEAISFATAGVKTAKTVFIGNGALISAINGVSEYLNISFSHFFNNLIKSVLIFPINLRFDKISKVLEQPYWDEKVVWNGNVGFVFFINLVIMIAGITILYKKHRGIGLLPLSLQIGYYLTLALGRTSGGRYLGPGIWVFYLYYLAGLYLVFETLVAQFGWELNIFSEKQPTSKTSSSKPIISAILIILVIGISIPIANEFIPERYEHYSREELIGILNRDVEFNKISTQDDEFNQFVDNGGGELFYGEVHYPVRITDSEDNALHRYNFSILGPSFSRYSQLESYQENLSFPDRALVVGFGCREWETDQILFLYFVEEQFLIQGSNPYRDVCLNNE